MDSINREQHEANYEELNGEKAVKKIKDLTDKNKTCFFCTQPLDDSSGTMVVRPMSLQQLDKEGNFWFLSARDSHKNQEIEENDAVQLLFQASEHSGFLTITGRASITTDRQKIEELWEPIVKTWFTEGIDDPRISVIKVEPEQGYYWDNKHGNAVAGIKMLIGAALGKTLDDSIEGTLRV